MEVGEITAQKLAQGDVDYAAVQTYAGPLKRSYREKMGCREGHLWRFINKYRPVDYALILHNNLLRDKDFREYKKYFPKRRQTAAFKSEHKFDVDLLLLYHSKRDIPKSIEDAVMNHLGKWYDKNWGIFESWPHPCPDNQLGDPVETPCRFFPPEEYDAIHIELNRPDRMGKKKAADYVSDLASLLSSSGNKEERNVNSRYKYSMRSV